MPYLGLCLGHQLLGEAMGGRVGPMTQPEVGILDVSLTEAGARDPVFAGLPPSFRALQWHGAEVAVAPPGAAVLAQSPACAIQAMRVGGRAYGVQYHVEITEETVPEWGAVPIYQCALDETLGPGALAGFERETARHMPDFNRHARRLYDNFMALARS
jgi:GMP synthase-like glutamine amidotransferase